MARHRRFDPVANTQTNALMQMLSQMAMSKWKTEQDKQLWTWQQQKQKEISQTNLQEMMTKFPGLFGNMGGGSPVAAADPFSKQPIPGAYVKGFDSSYTPEMGLFTPEQQKEMGFQQDINRFKAAQNEYTAGKSIPMTLEGKAKLNAMPMADRASFIKARMANFPGASTAMKELKPQFITPQGERQFTQDKSGNWEERVLPISERPSALAKTEATSKRQMLTDSTKIREEFLNRPEIKEYTTIKTQVKSMDALLNKAVSGNQQNKAALDQALITMFNKLTDPNSVVRESEYARTPENLPLINRFSGALQKISKGGAGLTDSDRKTLVWGAKVIADERGKVYNETLQGYVDLAGQYGIDTPLITRGLTPHILYEQTQNTPFNPRQSNINQTRSGVKFTIER